MMNKKSFSQTVYFKILIALLIFGGGIVLGYQLKNYISPPRRITTIRQNSSVYHFINPLLYIDNSEDTRPQSKNLQSQINNYIVTAKAEGKINTASVYFRESNTGRWIGINETEMYAPASMLKVILMIAYLKEAETDPAVLDKKLVYTGNANDDEYFQPSVKLNQGQSYTVRELILDMITQSDNNANDVLLKNIDNNFLFSVYNDLYIPVPTLENPDFMSAKMWSTIFRILYNSSYLTRSLSEESLQALSQTSFNEGLMAGLPASTTVAHKFGERADNVDGTSTEAELHDCGIVYYPPSPYFLCIMTKGNNYEDLKNVIAEISRMVYQAEANGL